MTFEEKLKEKASQNVATQDLPEKINAKIVGEPQFRNDNRNNEACYIKLQLEDGQITTQKYTPTTYKPLLEMVEKLGGLETMQKLNHTWIKRKEGRQQFERFFPTATTTETTPKKRCS